MTFGWGNFNLSKYFQVLYCGYRLYSKCSGFDTTGTACTRGFVLLILSALAVFGPSVLLILPVLAQYLPPVL